MPTPTVNPLLKWDELGEHLYETGVSKGVLYPYDTENEEYSPGYAWNGLSAITESPSGAEESAIYADDTKYLSLFSLEEFGGTIEAYTYPDEFMLCDGSASPLAGMVIGQQSRKTFGLCYKTVLGNDTEGEAYGYKLHLIYGCKASPSERAYQTINDSPEAITFSWEFTTIPVVATINGTEYKKTSIITLDSRVLGDTKMAAIEQILYGTPAVTGASASDEVPARLPLPSEVYSILNSAT